MKLVILLASLHCCGIIDKCGSVVPHDLFFSLQIFLRLVDELRRISQAFDSISISFVWDAGKYFASALIGYIGYLGDFLAGGLVLSAEMRFSSLHGTYING